ncbi:MAG: hypothetical protein HY842_18165 [Bacteroidetes bacterium]|nr:hypothetical protein [Bacteroidota bacterium]
MKSHKISGNFALVSGILLTLASLMHYFTGYPAINEMLAKESVGPETSQTLRVIWIFSSITMCLSGIWGIFISRDLKAGRKSAWWQGLLLGTGLVLFCVATQFFGFPNYHMMVFGVLGLLLVVPLLVNAGSFKD